MKCPIETRESAELLLEYCARKLDPESTAILQQHIAICPACREFADGQRALWDALDVWETTPVSADFDRRMYSRIAQEVGWWDRLVRPFRPLLVLILCAAAFAAAAQPALPVIQRQIGLTDTELGLFTAAYMLPAVVFAIPLGYLADTIGRPLLIAGAYLKPTVATFTFRFQARTDWYSRRVSGSPHARSRAAPPSRPITPVSCPICLVRVRCATMSRSGRSC